MKKFIAIASFLIAVAILASGCTTAYAPNIPDTNTNPIEPPRRTPTYCASFIISDNGVYFSPDEDMYTLLGITADDIATEKRDCIDNGKEFSMTIEAKMTADNKTATHTCQLNEVVNIPEICWLKKSEYFTDSLDVTHKLSKLTVVYELTLSYGSKTKTFKTIYIYHESTNPRHPGDYLLKDTRPKIA